MMSRLTLALAGALLVTPQGVRAQETHRIPGRSVAVYNLAGTVEVVAGSGSDVVVRMTRRGRDADRLAIETGSIGGRETLRVIYPDDRIIYPEMGRGSNTTQRVRADGTFSDGGRSSGDRVRISGSGSGLEAWADLVVEVPAGVGLELYVAVGDVDARGTRGSLRIDTGSGSVSAIDITGELTLDTGSGRVRVEDVTGSLSVDTGSGGVEVSRVSGDLVNVDTGSGRVTGGDIDARRLVVDTGSGSIDLRSVRSSDVALDTGSGSIDVELLTDVESLNVDTGSGSVTVRVPADLGASVEIETGSGGIDLDFPVQVRRVERDRLSGTIGDGRGRIVIDTGSGTIRLLRR